MRRFPVAFLANGVLNVTHDNVNAGGEEVNAGGEEAFKKLLNEERIAKLCISTCKID